jgi:hypothetical protein
MSQQKAEDKRKALPIGLIAILAILMVLIVAVIVWIYG